jgi:hypothetical protein
MQKLALMMAVMMLGMSPAHGCSTSVDPGGQGTGGQPEMILPPSTWSSDGGETLTTEGRISSTAVRGGPPVEPGGLPVRQILQQIQLGVEGLVRIKNEVLRIGQGAAKENPEERETSPARGRRAKATGPREKQRKRRRKL